MRLRISIRGRVRRSVGPYVPCYFRMTKNVLSDVPMTWTKRQSRTIQKWPKNVGPSVCPSIDDENKKMNNKWRQGSRIFWTPRFLFFLFFLCYPLFFSLSGWQLFSHLDFQAEMRNWTNRCKKVGDFYFHSAREGKKHPFTFVRHMFQFYFSNHLLAQLSF